MIDYKALLNQMIDEIDAATNHNHRLEMAEKAITEYQYYSVEKRSAYLQGLTDAHNAVRRIAQKFADQTE